MAISAAIRSFARTHFGRDAVLHATPLRGGLEAVGIAHIVVHRRRSESARFVAKPFRGSGRRELRMYQLLHRRGHGDFAPALLGWRYSDRRRSSGYMFLEWIAAQRPWPWSEAGCASLVVQRLAALHRMGGSAPHWDYERDLMGSAASTLEIYREMFARGIRPGGRPMLRSIERMVSRLPDVRRQLVAYGGCVLLHGDVHPGNVVIRDGAAVFLDWGRARMGSPLEDLASWVHTLALWEPEAKRRHDTLVESYREAKGDGGRGLPRDFRDALVLAGACNALAGALRYHLAVIGDAGSAPRQQYDSYCAAADWLRLIRRADACCSG